MRAKEFALLNELHMSPTRLAQFVKTDAGQQFLTGFEVECCLPGEFYDSDDYESEPDYDQDRILPSNVDFDDIRDFFYESSSRTLSDLKDEYADFCNEAFEDFTGEHVEDLKNEMMERDPDLDEDDAQDKAMKELSQQFYGNDQVPSLYTFFKENDCSTYLDVSENYGFEWQYWTEPNNDGAFDALAYNLQKVVKAEVVTSNEYSGARRGPTNWCMEPDGSIDPDDHNYMGVEIISPPMQVNVALDKLEKVLNWVKYENGHTNESTGLHVGVSIKGRNTDSIDYVKLALFLGDKYVLQNFQREFNSYTASSLEIIQKRVADNTDNSSRLDGLKAGLFDTVSKSIITRNSNRFVTINMHYDYIEFRSMGHDYLDRYAEIKNTILRYINAYAVAGDPNAERKEYAKKLTKLLNPNNDDRLTPFINFTAGQINRNQLVAAIQEKRKPKPIPADLRATSPANGQFTGRWEILDGDDAPIYSFGGIGNSQTDANRYAMNYLEQNNLLGTSEYTVNPIMS